MNGITSLVATIIFFFFLDDLLASAAAMGKGLLVGNLQIGAGSLGERFVSSPRKKHQQQRGTLQRMEVSVLEHGSESGSSEDGGGDAWSDVVVSVVRVLACFLALMVTTFAWAVLMLMLFPWPYARTRQGNIYGHVTGRLMMWILGNPIKIEGTEFSNTRAIYICNHASPLDIFLIMWLTPTGTVGIAKKEIIWYPLVGQLYVLANHLRIDRSNPTAAIESMQQAARAVVKHNLSLIIFPEGTRSKTGRLLPFKKGFVHIALQSGLPVVPIILTGTHRAWRKGGLRVRPAPITVRFLPPIETTDWEAERINEYVEMIHGLYASNLPKSQQPLALEGSQ